MKIQQVFVGSILIGLIMRMANTSWSLGFAEALILGSSAMILLICELNGIIQRIVAIEQIHRQKVQNEMSEADSVAHEKNTEAGHQTFDRLKHFLNSIIGERHPQTSRQHHDKVRDSILLHLGNCGWDVRLDEFDGSYGPAHNVIAEKRGTGDKPGVFIIGAHYDTVKGTPGADDNGIAVAGIMRLGELLGNCRFSKTVRLVAWDLEERQRFSQSLVGSRHMASNIHRAGEHIEGVICLEMIGMCSHRPHSQTVMPGLRSLAPQLWDHLEKNEFRGDFIAAVGNQAGAKLAEEFTSSAKEIGLPAVTLIVRGLIRLLRDLRRSDHAPFWDLGIPAIMVTDTSNFRSPYYHTPLDLPETIDFEFAAKVVESTATVIRRLAEVQNLEATSETQRSFKGKVMKEILPYPTGRTSSD